MNSDESSRGGMSNNYTRKPMPTKYGEKNHIYGPGQNYSYGNQPYNGTQPYNGNSHYNNGSGNYYNNGQQNQRRRPDHFKRENNYNYNERLVKQNDIIIRLLKEIRDRLPAPPQSTENQYLDEDQDHKAESHDSGSDGHDISEDDEVVMEPANVKRVSGQDNRFTDDDQ